MVIASAILPIPQLMVNVSPASKHVKNAVKMVSARLARTVRKLMMMEKPVSLALSMTACTAQQMGNAPNA